MASIIPVWLMGWDVTSVTIRFQVADATGLLGNGSPASTVRTLTGVIDAIEYSGEFVEEEIVPLTSRYENSVAIAINDRVRLVEIAVNTSPVVIGGAGVGNFLSEIKNHGQADGQYALFAMTRSGKTITFTAAVGELQESIRQGKSVMTLELHQLDIFDTAPTPNAPAPNPAYA